VVAPVTSPLTQGLSTNEKKTKSMFRKPPHISDSCCNYVSREEYNIVYKATLNVYNIATSSIFEAF
jgi:hypothetical protein